MTEARIAEGVIEYADTGTGEAVVFIHPFLTTQLHWRKVTPLLAEHVRCVVPTLPLGAHASPMRPEADLSPPGLARIVVDFLDAAGIERATLVGNDTGGAIAQIVAAHHAERVQRLVLSSCDAYDVFPPRMFAYLKLVARIPGATWLLAQSMRLPGAVGMPFAFGWVSKRPIPREVMRAYVTPVRRDAGVRRDVNKVVRGIDPRHTLQAAERLRNSDRPVLVAWGAEDRFFPRRLAERLASELPNAQLEWVEGARTFVPEDAPERLAELISKFVETT